LSLKLFYLLSPRVLAISNTLAQRRNRWVALVWSLIVVGAMVGLFFLCHRLLTRIDRIDEVSAVLATINTVRAFLVERAPTVGEMLNRTVLMMFVFSLMTMLYISNVITALSTFFSSEELDLVLSSPMPYRRIFFSKFAETLLQSSWMVFLVLVPFLAALGSVYRAPASYYLLFWIPIVPFLCFPAAAGIWTTLFLARAFPVGQTRNLLRFLVVLGTGLLLILFRVMRPELLVHPEKFRDLLTLMDTPWNPQLELVPSGWAVKEVLWLLGFPLHAAASDHLLLWGGALAVVLATGALAARLHPSTWQLHQEAEGAAIEGESRRGARPAGAVDPFRLAEGPVDRALARLAVADRAILTKDIRVFYRSPVLWTQVMLMVVIMVIYLYNIYLLPLKTIRGITPAFVEWLAFLNVGFVAFVVVALALRFGFPAVSMEGLGFYLIHSSPVGISRYVWLKYWSSFVPLMVVCVVLVVASDLILGVRPLVMAFSIADAVLFSMVIAAMAMCFGALYHDFRRQSLSEIPSSFGGMVFMVATLLVVTVLLGIQSVPFFYRAELSLSFREAPAGSMLALSLALVGASIAAAAGITVASLSKAIRHLRYLEVS
jgi:ABC-2 type transport system permease protein